MSVRAKLAEDVPAAAQPSTRANAPLNLTGNWVAVISEDWRWRMITPARGDFPSIPLNFEGQQVLITGASRGIGIAAAKEFLAWGARVAVNGRTEQSVATAITELGGGDRLIAAPGNIGTVDGCESAVRAAVAGLGGLNVLVNNAGVCIDSTIEKSDETIWDETVNINLAASGFRVG